MNNDANVFCSECGAPIKGEPPIPDDPADREPCPQCGSTLRNISLSASAALFGLGGMRATLTITTYSENLLAKVQELITNGDFSIAVVVAHMASEISAERAISQAFVQKNLEYLEEPMLAFLPGYNLANDRIRKLYNALTGRPIQDQSFWPAFKKSAERRNSVVHRGMTVTKAEAEASYAAASDLIGFLK